MTPFAAAFDRQVIADTDARFATCIPAAVCPFAEDAAIDRLRARDAAEASRLAPKPYATDARLLAATAAVARAAGAVTVARDARCATPIFSATRAEADKAEAAAVRAHYAAIETKLATERRLAAEYAAGPVAALAA